MKPFVAGFLLLVASLSSAGQDLVEGKLLDGSSGNPVQFAHVTNYRSDVGVITNREGVFRIPATLGDTIVFSSVGYQRQGWEVDKEWIAHGKIIELLQDTTVLDEVVINRIPPEEVFKKRVLEYHPEDTSFWYHGMPLPKPYDNSPLSERVINNPVFAITHPTDFLYYKFSKQEKEKRKYHQITKREPRLQRAYRKFSREWVHEVTSLEGEELTSFIEYCDYSLEYIEKTPKYIIQEDMLARLVEFKKSQKS